MLASSCKIFYEIMIKYFLNILGSKESALKHTELPVVSHQKVAFDKHERTYFYTLHDTVKVHGKL